MPIAQARELESKLGQLFIVNVDGFGTTGDLALEPGFVPMLKRLQIGGVIPHYGSTSYERIRRTNLALAGMTDLPLLLCCDIVKLRGSGRTVSFGDGYVGGFLGRYRVLPDDALETLARLERLHVRCHRHQRGTRPHRGQQHGGHSGPRTGRAL